MRCRADIVFPAARIAVFVDGCFWHGCTLHSSRPKANAAFWNRKIDGNIARDRRNDTDLRNAGWMVVRVWEHDDPAEAAREIEEFVRRQ